MILHWLIKKSVKQIGIKEKEQNRKNSVTEMISSEVSESVAKEKEKDKTTSPVENVLQDNLNESETIAKLKKQLKEALSALKLHTTKNTRKKDTRVNLLMYKEVYETIKKKIYQLMIV